MIKWLKKLFARQKHVEVDRELPEYHVLESCIVDEVSVEILAIQFQDIGYSLGYSLNGSEAVYLSHSTCSVEDHPSNILERCVVGSKEDLIERVDAAKGVAVKAAQLESVYILSERNKKKVIEDTRRISQMMGAGR